DAPSTSNSTTPTETQPLIIPQDVGDDNSDIKVAHMGSDQLVAKILAGVHLEVCNFWERDLLAGRQRGKRALLFPVRKLNT
nr:hypothetical protein [Tanacetum cinerariifolium]